MTQAQASISKDTNGGFYALVVRVQPNSFGGVESVVLSGYKGRHFASMKAAEKSTSAYIAKLN